MKFQLFVDGITFSLEEDNKDLKQVKNILSLPFVSYKPDSVDNAYIDIFVDVNSPKNLRKLLDKIEDYDYTQVGIDFSDNKIVIGNLF